MKRTPASVMTGMALATLVLTAPLPAQQGAQAPSVPATSPGPPRLLPTAHPAVPSSLNAFWYAPAQATAMTPALASFVKGVKLLDEEDDATAALPLLNQKALASGPLADYVRYYTGRALLRLERYQEAEAAFAAVAARPIEGHLPEDAAFAQAQAREGRKDFKGAGEIYAGLVGRKLAAPHTAWLRLAAAAELSGDLSRATDTYRRVYYEYPLSTEAAEAESALTRLDAWGESDRRVTAELARADALFKARRWSAARSSYDRARPYASGDERERVVLRLSACDVQLGRHRQARDPLRGQMAGPFADEASFYYITALRGLGESDEYVRQARIFADTHRDSPYAEELLSNLATHLIVADEDARADEVFRILMERYPGGRFTERAHWRSGWWAYRDGRFAEAARLFDRGAAEFPRSDYRPSWLYWSGRAWSEAGNTTLANERLTIAASDYHNSYYGRLALSRLESRKVTFTGAKLARLPDATTGPALATADRVAVLMGAGLNQEALTELQYAQRMWGASPTLTATIALAQNRLGNLRLGINAMKRAYPQWIASGGESLPLEIQKVVFPLDYWPLIQKHAAARGLDPFLVAALVAQESTFDPVIRSSANAVGLMQVLPSTGRQTARRLGIPRFTAAKLTDPETNVRLGTTIFSQGIQKFGGVHYALAAYNAGDHRVAGWRRERGDLPQDVFIDDIPFPETQNYVKRILGTAEDYRRLYGR